MIAILVFTFGLLSAYMLVDSAMSAAINGRDEIIAANLAREQIELVKNLRDTNWLQNLNFMSTGAQNGAHSNIVMDPPPGSIQDFSSGFYIIENRDGVGSTATIYLKKLNGFSWTQGSRPDLNEIQLCLKDQKYVHECLPGTEKTLFYSFIRIEPLKLDSNEVSNAFRLTSAVLTKGRGYREYVVRTIITDWKR
jgi:hypothetical protein